LGERYPYLPQIVPWVNLPIEIPFLKSPSRTWNKDVKEQGLKKSLISIESMDEIPLRDRWSLTTVISEEETGVLSTFTLNRC
jgi:hypothetical protein